MTEYSKKLISDFISANPRLAQSVIPRRSQIKKALKNYETDAIFSLSDPELQAISEETRAESARRVIESLGLEDPDPAVRIAVRGWVGFIEEATLDWLRKRDLDRDRLLAVQEQVLVHALEAAVAAGLPS